MNIRVSIVNTNDFLRAGIAELLRKERDIAVVGSRDGTAPAVKARDAKSDVLILSSSSFPPGKLPQAVQEIKRQDPLMKILLFLEEDMPETDLIHYLTFGVEGYVKKSSGLRHLVDAIRTVYAGNIWAERKLLSKFVALRPLPTVDIESRIRTIGGSLTKREREIASLLLLGLPNRALSEQLHISEKTVKTHLNNIFKKMKVSNRTQLVSTLIHPAHTKVFNS